MFCHDTCYGCKMDTICSQRKGEYTELLKYQPPARGSVVHSFLNIMDKWWLDGGHSPAFSLCSVDVQSSARQDSIKTIHLTSSVKARRWKRSHPSSTPSEMSAGGFVGSMVNTNGWGIVGRVEWWQWDFSIALAILKSKGGS